MKRRPPTLKEKLACMIMLYLQMPYEHAKTMSVADTLGLVDWDHDHIPVAIAIANGETPGQYNHPSRLKPRFSEDHAVKTATVDIPQIAKADRLSDAHKAFQARILAAKVGTDSSVPVRSKKSPWPQGRKMQSRPFQKKDKKDKMPC